jgi:hypothetical protein
VPIGQASFRIVTIWAAANVHAAGHAQEDRAVRLALDLVIEGIAQVGRAAQGIVATTVITLQRPTLAGIGKSDDDPQADQAIALGWGRLPLSSASWG